MHRRGDRSVDGSSAVPGVLSGRLFFFSGENLVSCGLKLFFCKKSCEKIIFNLFVTYMGIRNLIFCVMQTGRPDANQGGPY